MMDALAPSAVPRQFFTDALATEPIKGSAAAPPKIEITRRREIINLILLGVQQGQAQLLLKSH